MAKQAAAPKPIAEPSVEERVLRLENQVEALTEAVKIIAQGLEGNPMNEPPESVKFQDAARRARELLLLDQP